MGKEKKLGSGGNGDSYGDDDEMGKEKKLGSGGNGDSYDEMGKEKKLGWQWRTMAIVRR